MKVILAVSGEEIKVDDCWYSSLSVFKWYILKGRRGTKYAIRRGSVINGKRPTILIHRVISSPPVGMFVDHINHDGLDNRLENLRICTHSDNNHNQRVPINNTSGITGVFFNKGSGKWGIGITVCGVRKRVCSFKTKEEAFLALLGSGKCQLKPV